jgi:uncharacterized protein YyaL (SSP411 family)
LGKELSRKYIPFTVVQWSESENSEQPLMYGKTAEGGPWLYLCRNYTCRKPVRGVDELMQLIESESASKSEAAQ